MPNRWSLLIAIAIALPGCSFRAPGPGPGQIEAIDVSVAGHGVPSRIRAVVAFAGVRKDVVLSIVPDGPANTIQVAAFGTPPLPPFDLGVIPVDRTSRQTYEVETAVILNRPGTWQVVGLSGDDARATVTRTVTVQ